MEITEVRIKLMENAEDRLRAFCSITLDDCFVVRDLKIIDGNSGPFVAMPSRRLMSHCRGCNTKNHLRARYCNQCGRRLASDLVETDDSGRARLYADIAHPINPECRELIQNHVIGEFYEELERARQPGYVSRYDDDYDDRPRRKPVTPADAAVNEQQRVDQPAETRSGPHFGDDSSRPTPEPARQMPEERREKPGQREADPNARGDFGDGLF